MTLDQTRQLAIEFERRINALDQSTESINKLDTDTIYAYLNQYQTQYIQSAYISQDQATSGSRPSRKLSDIAKTLVTHKILTTRMTDYIGADEASDCFKLPDDYYMYIRSNSAVRGTYKAVKDLYTVGNVFIKQDDVKNVLQSYYNYRGIIRNPMVVLTSQTAEDDGTYLQVIHDIYTNIAYVELIYYRCPNRFNIIDGTACELPFECFDDLVDGAVRLYISYKYPNLNNPERRRKNESEEQ